MKKSKAGLESNQRVTDDATPADNELLCYSGLTEEQYTAGLAFASGKKMGHEHGYRPDGDGYYIKLFPENRQAAFVTQFEADIK